MDTTSFILLFLAEFGDRRVRIVIKYINEDKLAFLCASK